MLKPEGDCCLDHLLFSAGNITTCTTWSMYKFLLVLIYAENLQMTCSTLKKALNISTFWACLGRALHHGCFRGSFSEGELGRHIQFMDRKRLSFSEGKIRSLCLGRLTKLRPQRVLLWLWRQLAKRKLRKASVQTQNCLGFELLRFKDVKYQFMQQ